MVPLPSGKLAGISNVRARYHALRLNRLVKSDTSHHDLYGLVDIVVSPDRHKRLPCKPHFLFTGHTLADLHSIRHWSPDDRKVFHDWIRKEPQIREIDQARRRIVSDELPLIEQEYSYPQRLYSTLQKRVACIPMQQASPQQWMKTLLNMRRFGIRDEEITWSGLLAFLNSREDEDSTSISRDELLSHIDFSIIRLSLTNELASGNTCKLEFVEIPTTESLHRLGTLQQITKPSNFCVLRYVDPIHYYKVGYLKNSKSRNCHSSTQQWFVLDTIGNLVGNSHISQCHFPTKEQAFSAASQHALQHIGLPIDYTQCSRYEHKTLCGGSDYREWLLTLPDYPLSHFTSHYYARNLLLHFRTKKRLDSQGRQLLFIEEIQSDWHQSGAMHGYQNRWPGRIPPAPFRKEWVGLALKLILLHTAHQDFDGIAWTRGEVQESHYFKQLNPVKRLYDKEIPRVLQRLCHQWSLKISSTKISTKEPRLHIRRQMDKWLITDETGDFFTRPRYTQQEAMKVMARHCKQIDLEVPALFLTKDVKEQILRDGFPLFGEKTIE